MNDLIKLFDQFIELLEKDFKAETGRSFSEERHSLAKKSEEVANKITEALCPIGKEDAPAIILACTVLSDTLEDEWPGAKAVAESLRKLVKVNTKIEKGE